MKDKQKIPTKTPDQQRAENHANLMNVIIAETFARHSGISEEEYLKKIGFENSGKTEDEAIRIAKFNIMMSITREILDIEGKINMANGLLRTYLIEENIAEEDKSEDKGE